MNTTSIKSYAPKARRDFIQAVTEKAHLLGLSEDHIEPIDIKGDVAIIAGRPYPRQVGQLRKELEARIKQDGFELTMRKMAYTWFNRFVAIRYMELHDYLDYGYRVLSNRSGSEIPEILEHATDVEIPGLNKKEVARLCLAGDKDNELYQLLLVAQCNALSQAMPFLFEKIGGSTELLMPDNLLHSNSPVRNLVNEIPEEDWQQIEIIGWIYQFYISEKKDEVIGKVVKSEDIPAATQLFTPNWIVKYMVQNSLGAQWLTTYPQSPLKGQMDYYFEPAEQTDEVKAQLAAITPNQLNPEELTLIDPACGSGHILVEAYELFKAIYLERGYRQRDVPELIFEKNLFGLDIDERAAQLTGFALMMKGRADDRRLFERGVKLNVMALVDSGGFDAERLVEGLELSGYGLKPGDLTELQRLFEHATTFGSLIQVPEALVEKLPPLKQLSAVTSQDLFVSEALTRFEPLVQQAELLAAQYDVVVANPPYMGGKVMNQLFKKFTKNHFPRTKTDIFACFIERNISLAKRHGFLGFMSPQVWMFLSSYRDLRARLLADETLISLVQPEYNAFWDSAHVTICSYVLRKSHINEYSATFIDLTAFYGAKLQPIKTLEAISNPACGWLYATKPDDFKKIPGAPISFATGDSTRNCFTNHPCLEDSAEIKLGISPGHSERFLREWTEVSWSQIGMEFEAGLATEHTWYPTNKGGSFRRWYGNCQYVMNWRNDGHEIRNLRDDSGRQVSRPQNLGYQFRPHIAWTRITPSHISFRSYDSGYLFTDSAVALFCEPDNRYALGFLNTTIVRQLAKLINPTLNYQPGDLAKLPLCSPGNIRYGNVQSNVEQLLKIARQDWDAYERSWKFQSLPLMTTSSEPTPTLESSYTAWINQNRETIVEMKRLEEENNSLFIEAYGLGEELTPKVPIEQITLTVNPSYRYGGKMSVEEQWTRFRQDTMKELVSYAIGCMMGRYSLDAPGLIYAHSGNEGFDPSRYPTFPADDDGIVPLTDTEWFDDDAAHRLIEFISVAWDDSNLEDNIAFIADNLGPKRNESSQDTLRRYLNDKFFKEHLQTYKKRPIYWFFSSGKQKAFQCLVYLHRYNESTLSRVRSAYVTPLFGKFNARLEYLQNEWEAADSASAKKKFQKEIDGINKKLGELSTFDDELRHYADKRISLDLDDGVKVNYGKFGNLLAEKKAVTGKK